MKNTLINLINEINVSFELLMTEINIFPKDKYDDIVVGTYNFRDVVAHIHEWEMFLIESFEAIQKKTLKSHKLNIKKMNLDFYNENKDKSIETVLKDLKLGHEKLISTVKTFDETLLSQPDPYYPEKHSIYTLAQHCTSLHYPWAIKFLKKYGHKNTGKN